MERHGRQLAGPRRLRWLRRGDQRHGAREHPQRRYGLFVRQLQRARHRHPLLDTVSAWAGLGGC